MSDRRALIFGKGGHARVIRSLLPHAEFRFVVDRDPAPGDLPQADFFADGGSAAEGCDLFIGIGDDHARRLLFDRLKALGLDIASCIAPTAWVAPGATLGEGVFLGPGATICAGSRIGDNVIVNTHGAVDHDCAIGADTQIAPGATLGSHLKVGRACYFGMKSCVLPRLEIGDGARIMAGALVVRPVPAGVLVGGSPARVMRGAGADEAEIRSGFHPGGIT
ncbi:MAG TPA: acetyltransferase [Allosphingosinicella sp.]|nr:acetyltransferase [Allosphingosinicella sp.]